MLAHDVLRTRSISVLLLAVLSQLMLICTSSHPIGRGGGVWSRDFKQEVSDCLKKKSYV